MLEILNNKKCPFCDMYFVLDNKAGTRFMICPRNHMRALFRTENHDSVRISIFFPNFSISFVNEKGYDASPLHIYLIEGSIDIPMFNVFEYSHEDLEKKIKLYILFS